MSDIREVRKALVRRILEGAGKASPSERRAAFNLIGLAGSPAVLVDKVARNAAPSAQITFSSGAFLDTRIRD